MNNELIEHLEMIHTTPMGEVRIKKNLQISCDDTVEWCKQQIMKTDTIFEKKGKKLVCLYQIRYSYNQCQCLYNHYCASL